MSTAPETPVDLQTELTRLRRDILAMAAGVEQRVSRSIRALFEHDIEMATIVRTGDEEIDEMEVDIEAECLRILALHQPVASDLRFVLAVIRINSDLERVADMAKAISKRVIAMAEMLGVEPPQPLRQMGAAAQQMLADAVSAFADADTEKSRRVLRSDRGVDDLQKEVFVWVQEEIPLHLDRTKTMIDILTISRRLERIADLATNIAEDTVFYVEGSVIRHKHVQ